MTSAAVIALSSTMSWSIWSATHPPLQRDFDKPLDLHQIETIVLGTSHAYFGVATPELSNAYNLAICGQDLWYDSQVAEGALARLPQLKRVIFTASPATFRFCVASDAAPVWGEAAYLYAAGIPSRIKGRELSSFLLANQPHWQEDHFKILTRKANFADEPNLGWRAEEHHSKNATKDGTIAANNMNNEPVNALRMAENRSLLITTIKKCQAAGVSCVLITTPMLSCLREHIEPALWAEFEEGCQAVIEETGIRHFNHLADPAFDQDDFIDCDHLHSQGAVKFTRILESELRAHDLSQQK